MELTFTSLSPLALGAANCHKTFVMAPPRIRIKQERSAVPEHLTITSKSDDFLATERRTANYHPSIWEHEFIESLSTPYTVSITSICIYVQACMVHYVWCELYIY